MPGVGGSAAASAVTAAPTRVPLTYAAALAVQNTSGANITQIPISAEPQRSGASRHDTLARPSSTSSAPEMTSLATSPGSTSPKVGGAASSHAPSAAVKNGPHRVRRWWRRKSASALARSASGSSASPSSSSAASSHGGGVTPLARYQPAGSRLSALTSFGSASRMR